MKDSWLQVCFNSVYLISAVAIQGRGKGGDGMVTNYRINYGYSPDSVNKEFKLNGIKHLFEGALTRYGTSVTNFPHELYARCIRLQNMTCLIRCAARIEMLGCKNSSLPAMNITRSETALYCVVNNAQPTLSWRVNGHNIDNSLYIITTITDSNVNGYVKSILTFKKNINDTILDLKNCKDVSARKILLCSAQYSCNAAYGDKSKEKTLVVRVAHKEEAACVKDIYITSSNTSAHINWTIFSTRRILPLSFDLVLERNGSIIYNISDLNETNLVITTLTPFTEYYVKITSRNKYSISLTGSKTFFTKQGVSEPPRTFSCAQFNFTSLVFKWKKPSITNGIIHNYKIMCCRSNCKEKVVRDDISASMESATVYGLATSTEYHCKIQAYTAKGQIAGIWSSVFQAKTMFKDVCSLPVGIENGLIPDEQLQYGKKSVPKPRLNSEKFPCLNLQQPACIDLGKIMTITGMAFQGNSSVENVYIRFGTEKGLMSLLMNGTEGTDSRRLYRYPAGELTLRHWFEKKDFFTARYIEMNFQGAVPICFKMELYGCEEICSEVLQPKSIKASKVKHSDTELSKINYDMKKQVTIAGILVKKNKTQKSSIKIETGSKQRNVPPLYNKDLQSDFTNELQVMHWFNTTFVSNFLKIIENKGNSSFLIIGCKSACMEKLWTKSNLKPLIITSNAVTSTDDFKLNAVGNPKNIGEFHWIQICFNDLKVVSAIAIQGRNNSGKINNYQISFAYKSGSRFWDYVFDGKNQSFNGPYNRYSTKVNYFPVPVTAACLRLTPQEKTCAIRWDLLGCNKGSHPKILPIDPVTVYKGNSTSLQCKIVSQPGFCHEWILNGNYSLPYQKYHLLLKNETFFKEKRQINGTNVSVLRIQKNITELIGNSSLPCSLNSLKDTATCYLNYSCVAFYKDTIKGYQHTKVTYEGLNATVVPPLLKTTKTNTTAIFTWNHTAYMEKSDFPIVRYALIFNETTWKSKVVSATMSRTQSGLLPHTDYSVALIAYNRLNVASTYVTQTFRTEQGVPSACQDLKLEVLSEEEISVSWIQPSPANGIISKYEIEYMMNGTAERFLVALNSSLEAESVSAILSNLRNYKHYKVRVRAYTNNNLLVGPWSEWKIERTFEGKPSAPRHVQGNPFTPTSVNISWQQPSEINGVIQTYTISTIGSKDYFKDFKHHQVNETSASVFHLDNLYPGTVYSISINAATGGGTGPQSDVIEVNTTYDKPYAAKILVNRSNIDTEIMFYSVKPYTGPISYYLLNIGNSSFDCPSKMSNSFTALEIDKKNLSISGNNVKIQKGNEEVIFFGQQITLDLIGNFTLCWQAVIINYDGTEINGILSKEIIERRDLQSMDRNAVSTTNTTISIVLSEGPSGTRFYQIVVVEGYEDSLRPDPKKLKPFKKAGEPYITANISAADFEQCIIFTIGNEKPCPDNSQIGYEQIVYENVKLKKGTNYSVIQLAIVDENTYYSSPWLSSIRTHGKHIPPQKKKTGDDNTSLIIVVVVILVVVVGICIAAGIIFHKKRQGNNESASSPVKNRSHIEMGLVNDGQDADENDEMMKEDALDRPPPDKIVIDPKHPAITVKAFPNKWKHLKKDSNIALTEEFKALASGQQFRWDDAMTAESREKNRYANIVTYNHSRIHLPSSSTNQNDYINASSIHGYRKHDKYIATQGPKPKTINDFWWMIWVQNIHVIVMTTNLVEKNKKKCEQYWPTSGGCSFGDVEVTLSSTDTYSHFIIRTFVLKKGDVIREVMQFHFISWPDHGVPESPIDLVEFRNKMRKTYPADHAESPILVHCSAGVGRTGTFICIDEMLDLAQQENKVDIFNFVNFMRSRRIHMVQTEDQYLFVYRAILESLTCGVTEIEASDIQSTCKRLSRQNGTSKTGFQVEYEHLNVATIDSKTTATTAALKPENKSKNRHSFILPRDDSRVFLLRYDTDDNYINAVFVHGYKKKNCFISTPHPLPSTVQDFWFMVNQNNIGTIVMLNSLYEDECYECFWPNVNETLSFDETAVSVLSESTDRNITSRNIQVKSNKDDQKIVDCTMFQYLSWGKTETPKSALDIVNLLTLIEKQQHEHGDYPIIVMCSDGAGRAGCFIAISILMEYLRLEQHVDVFQTVKKIRTVQPQFVGTAAEYKFCYEVLLAYVQSFDTYSNYATDSTKF